MQMPKPKPKPSPAAGHSANVLTDAPERMTTADLLREIPALEIRLENGRKCAFSMAEELKFPTDPDDLRQAAIQAPSQLAFWNYQLERSLHALRVQGGQTKKVESEWYIRYRKFRNEKTDGFTTEAQLRADLDLDNDVMVARSRLHATKLQHGLCRAMRDSVEHRVYLLRRLIEPDRPTTSLERHPS
jgi:hypothetical protein